MRRPLAQVILTGFRALMVEPETHTSVVSVPREVKPVVSAVTVAETVSDVPEHFLFLTVPSVGAPMVVVLPLLHFNVPPLANAVTGRGAEVPPVFPLQPLAMTEPVTVPAKLLQVMLFSALAFAHAGLPKAIVRAHAAFD